MARPPLPIGTWGEIATWVVQTDDNGKPSNTSHKPESATTTAVSGQVSAFGRTKTAAERNLMRKLQDRARTNQSGVLTTMHKMNDLLDRWEQRFEEMIADGTRSPTSLDTYRRVLKNHIRPALGELRIGQANTPRIDTVLAKIKKHPGAPTARTCRAVLSGAMKLAVRYGAISVNPVREVDTIEAKPNNQPRALTSEEVTLLRKRLAADEQAVQADLPDLTTFMLSTGVRIGESLAVLWHQVDLEGERQPLTSEQ
ncbi:tyrosine-type recombinase/integrase [Kribbella sp. NPDC059898]|uniref:tyrosine-type recombinase/integrase n=1 Tax=Kribbella sp. NPDC059898 TaxID=3346995 RepID=UPI00365C385C